MVKVTQEQIQLMVKMQQIESETAEINHRLSQVENRIQDLDHELDGFKIKIDDAQTAVIVLNKNYRLHEIDLQSNVGRIEKSSEKLRAAKTNKEYQSGLKEIDDVKSMNSSLEDDMLKCLEQIDAIEDDINKQRKEFKVLADDIESEKESVRQKAVQGEQRLSVIEAELRDVSANLKTELVSLFKRVKSQMVDGIAIAMVKDAVCQSCHMNIPPQMYNELQHGDNLKNCPSCERVIYGQPGQERSE